MPITYPPLSSDESGETRVEYEGAVLDTGEINGYDDSDFYAVVWDGEKVTRVTYASTRYYCESGATIDATDEVKELAAEYLRGVIFKMWQSAQDIDSKRPYKGREVRFVKGRPTLKLDDDTRKPIKLGTKGTVIWREERRSQHGTWSYGFRLGIAVGNAATKQYSIRKRGDTLSVTSPYDPNFPWEARQIDGDWNKKRKVWTFPANRRAEVEALCERYFPAKPKNVVWTNEENVEVVNPEQYLDDDEVGHAIAERGCRNWRGATATGVHAFI